MTATTERRGMTRRWPRSDLVLVAILAVAFVVRLAWSLYAARRPEVFGDPFAYLTHGEEIARGDGYRTFDFEEPGDPTAYYPVGYPAILGASFWLVHRVASTVDTMGIAIALNIALGVATVGLLYDLARRLADRLVARIAAALSAVFPGLVLYTATVHLETVFTFLVVLIAWVLLARPWTAEPPSLGHLVAVGVLMAAATYVRPIVVVFVPVLVLFFKRAGSGWKDALRSAAVIIAVVVVAILPWSIRSSTQLDGLVILSTNTGDNLCVGHQPESRGHYHHLADFCWQGLDEETVEDEVARDRANTRRAVRYALENPTEQVELLARKTYHLFEHDHEAVLAVESYGEDPFLSDRLRGGLKAGADTYYYAVLLLTLVGLAPGLREGDLRRRVLVAWVAVLLATPLIFFGGARFHVPALPFFAFLAALPLASLWRRTRDRSRAS